MRHAIILAALLALAAPARADMVENCEQGLDPDLQIAGCTAVIRSGDWQGVELAAAYNNRGFGYDELGEYARAIADYEQALRLDPGYAAAYSNRGVTYGNLGDHTQAITDYDQALRLDPSLAKTYQNRGISHEFMGNYVRAAEDWERAIRIDGASRAEWWQSYMKSRGHYSGPIDGVFTPGLRRDLLACAIDPAC